MQSGSRIEPAQSRAGPWVRHVRRRDRTRRHRPDRTSRRAGHSSALPAARLADRGARSREEAALPREGHPMTSTIRVAVAAAVVLLPHGAIAQIAVAPPPYTLVVWGDASVSAPPDRARIDIAVTTRADSARQAASTNAAQADRLLAELKKVTGSTATVATAAYSVRPEYRYPKEGAEPQIAGYVATNTVRVETSTLDHV